MAEAENNDEPVLLVVFYRTSAGNEPAREWLKSLKRADRKRIGEDIKTAQFGWPLGMPLIRKLEPGLWEVRSRVSQGISRVIFTVEGNTMVLLHGFIKKSQKTPPVELKAARQRLADCAGSNAMNKQHIGSNFDEFLQEEGLLDAAQATAVKRVIAFQIAQEMKRRKLTKSEMASRMKTSPAVLDRLLDPGNRSVTISTLERAASALGKKLKVELA
jgi:phage-related protein